MSPGHGPGAGEEDGAGGNEQQQHGHQSPRQQAAGAGAGRGRPRGLGVQGSVRGAFHDRRPETAGRHSAQPFIDFKKRVPLSRPSARGRRPRPSARGHAPSQPRAFPLAPVTLRNFLHSDLSPPFALLCVSGLPSSAPGSFLPAGSPLPWFSLSAALSRYLCGSLADSVSFALCVSPLTSFSLSLPVSGSFIYLCLSVSDSLCL